VERSGWFSASFFSLNRRRPRKKGRPLLWTLDGGDDRRRIYVPFFFYHFSLPLLFLAARAFSKAARPSSFFCFFFLCVFDLIKGNRSNSPLSLFPFFPPLFLCPCSLTSLGKGVPSFFLPLHPHARHRRGSRSPFFFLFPPLTIRHLEAGDPPFFLFFF